MFSVILGPNTFELIIWWIWQEKETVNLQNAADKKDFFCIKNLWWLCYKGDPKQSILVERRLHDVFATYLTQ